MSEKSFHVRGSIGFQVVAAVGKSWRCGIMPAIVGCCFFTTNVEEAYDVARSEDLSITTVCKETKCSRPELTSIASRFATHKNLTTKMTIATDLQIYVEDFEVSELSLLWIPSGSA